MPTYDYVCDACEHAFEEFQYMSDDVLKKCPKCGKKKLRRLIGTGAAIIFKGSGFYQTDYRSESYKSSAKADSAPAADTSKPASGDKGSTNAGKTEPSSKPSNEAKNPGKSSGKSKKSET
jgi:putative FmdB family regulatory protein